MASWWMSSRPGCWHSIRACQHPKIALSICPRVSVPTPFTLSIFVRSALLWMHNGAFIVSKYSNQHYPVLSSDYSFESLVFMLHLLTSQLLEETQCSWRNSKYKTFQPHEALHDRDERAFALKYPPFERISSPKLGNLHHGLKFNVPQNDGPTI